jgi:general secretion pathway protein D
MSIFHRINQVKFLSGLVLGLALWTPAWAQDAPKPVVTTNPDGTTTVSPSTTAGTSAQIPADPSKADSVIIDFGVDTSLWDLVVMFTSIKGLNFVVADVNELKGKKVTMISSQKSISKDAAWEAFLTTLEVSGYTLSITGNTAKVVKAADAGTKPIPLRVGEPRDSDGYVTQLIQLENTRADDMAKIIQGMVSAEAKIVSYPPTNTLIITDTGSNIRKVYKLMKELDVASPKSTMEIYQLQYAAAADVKQIIEDLYGTQATESDERTSAASRTPPSTTRGRASSRTAASRRSTTATDEASVSAGDESKFIAKVIEEERTNGLIVLANEDGHAAVRDIIARVDIDVDPTKSAQIHVVYLEHAKADEVAQVLQQLSQESPQGRRQQNQQQARPTTPAAGAATSASRTTPSRTGDEAPEGGALAAFESGMRIAPDEATNSLVIIANPADFKVVEGVIKKLDVERRQVFVDVVIMELSSDDQFQFGLAAHVPQSPSEDSVGFIGAQLGATSLGLTPDALSGLAVGVFGESVDVPLADGTVLAVPAFGIVLNAMKVSGTTNIISNANVQTLDNEEAMITAGRKVPFPTSSALNNLGQPVVTFQREDVALTLKVTPRVNSSDYVTLEIDLEVQEVEESALSAISIAQNAGPVTSNRQVTSVALVADNETVVLGGLVASTDGETETKVPILGDIPLIGVLFRSHKTTSRKTNLMMFLTPHIIDGPEDVLEIQRVKEAQRQEFLRRFYGTSRDEYFAEMRSLLRYSMNFVDEASVYRGPTNLTSVTLEEGQMSEETAAALKRELGQDQELTPGSLPEDDQNIVVPAEPPPAPEPAGPAPGGDGG